MKKVINISSSVFYIGSLDIEVLESEINSDINQILPNYASLKIVNINTIPTDAKNILNVHLVILLTPEILNEDESEDLESNISRVLTTLVEEVLNDQNVIFKFTN